MDNRLNIITAVIAISLLGCAKHEFNYSDAHFLGINKYTCGTILNSEPIKIVFSNKVHINPMLINVPLMDSPFTFSPDIKGTALWIDDSTLQFIPSQELKGEQTYKASLNTEIFCKNLEGKFVFSFTPVKKTFEVVFDGLKPSNPGNPAYQQLEGKILTSGIEDKNSIQKMVSALRTGKNLDIIWKNTDNKKIHPFIIDSILREEQPSFITIFWNGKPIGIEKGGEHTLKVPSIHSFFVINARSVQGEKCYVEVKFNDPLDPKQNLKGLLRAGSTKNDFIVSNNIVRICNSSGWRGTVGIQIEPGIRNCIGEELIEPWHGLVFFEELPPQLKFCDSGLIIPFSDNPTIEACAVNINKIKLEAFEIFENTIPQFFQINDFFGNNEIKRVGKVIWTKEIQLDSSEEISNQINRFKINIKPLLQKQNSRFFRIKLSSLLNRAVKKNDNTFLNQGKMDFKNKPYPEKDNIHIIDNFKENRSEKIVSNNICNYNNEFSVCRNILISDIGLTAKIINNNEINIVTTSLTKASPLPFVSVDIYDYQQQIIASGKTDRNGLLTLNLKNNPFLVNASKLDQKSYLPINSILSETDTVKHRKSIDEAIDGFIYCERNIWCAGDSIFATFIFQNHDQINQTDSVILNLKDSKNNTAFSTQTSQSLNGFHVFRIPTKQSSPDGLWNLQIRIGNSLFEKHIRVVNYSIFSENKVLKFSETIVSCFDTCNTNKNIPSINKDPLAVKINKTRFLTGDTVSVYIPSQSSQYVLVNIENSKSIILQKWIKCKRNQTTCKFNTLPEMIPGVNINFTLFNPLSVTRNNNPVKTHGTIPITVIDSSTIIYPVIETSEIQNSNEKIEIKISESSKKAMTYTITIVNEYLLEKTGFQTPDPWKHFYNKTEHITGIKEHDLLNKISYGYIDSIKSIDIANKCSQETETGNPLNIHSPFIMFSGPFELQPNKRNIHETELPTGSGLLRIMVTAGNGKAYGCNEKKVDTGKPQIYKLNRN